MYRYELTRIICLRYLPKDLWYTFLEFFYPQKKRLDIKNIFGEQCINALPPIIFIEDYANSIGSFSMEYCNECGQIIKFMHMKGNFIIHTVSDCKCNNMLYLTFD